MCKSFETKTALFYIILVLLSFLPYISLLNAEFVHWDDDVYIVDNSRVKKGITLENIKWAFTTTYFGFYYPLTWLSHMLDCSLYGLNAKGHHLTSIIWHILNTILLFLFFKKSTSEILRSFVLASLFAVHPLNVESVGWISERKNLLAGFFFFLGLNFYIHYAKNKNVKNYVIVFITYILGMVAKPILITFPAALFLLDIWPLKRFALSGNLFKENRSLIIEKIWFLIPAPLFVYLTIIAQKEADALVTLSYITLKDRIAGAIIAYKDYILNFFFPLKLAALYPHLKNNYSIFEVISSVILLLFLFALCIKMFKKESLYLIGFLWFIINLTPVIGIIQVGEQARADRYMYIPMVGLFMAIVYGLSNMFKSQAFKKVLIGVYFFVLIAFTIKTHYQCLTWKNTETLFANMIKVSPNASHGYHNIAIIFKEKGNIIEAIENYNKAIALDPCKAKSLNNLGSIYAEKGDFENAVKYFQKAIECNPKLSQGYYNLGLIYENLGKIEEAIKYYQKTIEINPEKGNAYNNIGICYLKKGELFRAKEYFKKAIELSPNNPQIIFNNALANEQTGDEETAENLYRKVLQIDKKHLSSRKRLASILVDKKDYKEALKILEEGITIYPSERDFVNLKEEILSNEKK